MNYLENNMNPLITDNMTPLTGEIAKRMGVSTQTIKNWIRQQYVPGYNLPHEEIGSYVPYAHGTRPGYVVSLTLIDKYMKDKARVEELAKLPIEKYRDALRDQFIKARVAATDKTLRARTARYKSLVEKRKQNDALLKAQLESVFADQSISSYRRISLIDKLSKEIAKNQTALNNLLRNNT